MIVSSIRKTLIETLTRSGFYALTQGNVWKSQHSEVLFTLIALILVVSAVCQLSAGEARV